MDEAFDGPPLQPRLPVERARANQIISVVDSYAYWPLVRQVFAHGVFAERLGRPAALAEVEEGLQAAPRILGALERLARDRAWLVSDELSLADIHLAPMMAYFVMHEPAHACLMRHERLAKWWSAVAAAPAFTQSAPVLPAVP